MTVYMVDQAGVNDGGTWDETSSSLTIPKDGSKRIGLRFTAFPTRHTGEDFEETDRLYDGMTIQLRGFDHIVNDGIAGTLTYRVVEENDPAPFSNSRLPGSLDETKTGEQAVSDATADLSFDLSLGPITSRYRRVGWKGALALTVEWVGDSDLVLLVKSGVVNDVQDTDLTTSERLLDSGQIGERWIGSRILKDAKTGEDIREDDAVVDPLTRGLVASENADPPEERRRHRQRQVLPRRKR